MAADSVAAPSGQMKVPSLNEHRDSDLTLTEVGTMAVMPPFTQFFSMVGKNHHNAVLQIALPIKGPEEFADERVRPKDPVVITVNMLNSVNRPFPSSPIHPIDRVCVACGTSL
jgi:hypothetical protein